MAKASVPCSSQFPSDVSMNNATFIQVSTPYLLLSYENKKQHQSQLTNYPTLFIHWQNIENALNFPSLKSRLGEIIAKWIVYLKIHMLDPWPPKRLVIGSYGDNKINMEPPGWCLSLLGLVYFTEGGETWHHLSLPPLVLFLWCAQRRGWMTQQDEAAY